MQIDKNLRSAKRKIRLRKRISGTATKPRLSVKFSGKHIYAQCINDEAGTTMFFLASVAKDMREKKIMANVAGATVFGYEFGQRAASSGLKEVVFDRGDRKYHGCVKAFADSVRKAGLLF